ncbi:hypothetical protein LINPERPRIM_LOCUS20299 [Linum perenne]
MASLTAGFTHSLNTSTCTLPRNYYHHSSSPLFFTVPSPSFHSTQLSNRNRPISCFAKKNKKNSYSSKSNEEEEEPVEQGLEVYGETLLYSVSPLPLLFLAAIPGGGVVRSVFGPFVEIVKSLNLPGWLVHWGHPGNMEEKAKAKDLHPKLLAGMFFFFALGATGGVTSLLTSDRPIFESPHAVTGLIGLGLLTLQTILPSLFEGNPGLRNVHGILGSGIMALFLIHAALGLQLGLSY